MNKLEAICQGQDLSIQDTADYFNEILCGKLNDAQMSALLIALKSKGESINEILGALQAMQQNALSFPCLKELRSNHPIVDCVGTGGDNQQSLNISTPSSIMAAAMGLKVAKHGNRAVSSKCGTADLLEGVGVNITMSAHIAKKTLIETGFTFLFAPHYHSATQNIKAVRAALKTRTIFNALGPLLNPVMPDTLLVGVYHPSLCQRFAHVLKAQRVQRALVVHGQGLDEMAVHGVTTGELLVDDSIYPFTLTPEAVGLSRFELTSLRGDDLHFNRQHFLDLLQGKGQTAYRCAVALNTGTLLWLAEKVSSITEGVTLTLQALETDLGFECLQHIIEVSHA
ncbi:MAG: anthranilate phosphoribosyltransferase [Candidatus Berkiella sp.]